MFIEANMIYVSGTFARILVFSLLLAYRLSAKVKGEVLESGITQEHTLEKIDHAIIVTYRNRELHLQVFRQHMSRYLEDHFPDESFAIWIVEQDNDDLFWKTWLVNAGYMEITQVYPSVKCVTMHDVDMIPTSFVPYNSCDYPLHQIRRVSGYKGFTLPYPHSFGGIVTLSKEHWARINGMGNEYRGWGCEDDDMYYRLRANDLLINVNNSTAEPRRPPDGQGLFSTIDESSEHHPIVDNTTSFNYNCEILLGQMKRCGDRWKWDGLSNVCYKVSHRNSSMEGRIPIYHLKIVECAANCHSNSLKETMEIDTKALEAYLQEQPYDSHAWLDLADSCRSAGQLEKAKKYYRKRIQIGGSYEYEIWKSQFNLGMLAVDTNEPEGIVVSEFLDAFELNSYWAAPLYQLARYFRKKGEPKKAYVYASVGVRIKSGDIKASGFARQEHFLCAILEELCISAFYAGQMAEGREACLSILDLVEQKRIGLHKDTIARVKNNLQFYINT